VVAEPEAKRSAAALRAFAAMPQELVRPMPVIYLPLGSLVGLAAPG
jgi:hypothetical protein